MDNYYQKASLDNSRQFRTIEEKLSRQVLTSSDNFRPVLYKFGHFGTFLDNYRKWTIIGKIRHFKTDFVRVRVALNYVIY